MTTAHESNRATQVVISNEPAGLRRQAVVARRHPAFNPGDTISTVKVITGARDSQRGDPPAGWGHPRDVHGAQENPASASGGPSPCTRRTSTYRGGDPWRCSPRPSAGHYLRELRGKKAKIRRSGKGISAMFENATCASYADLVTETTDSPSERQPVPAEPVSGPGHCRPGRRSPVRRSPDADSKGDSRRPKRLSRGPRSDQRCGVRGAGGDCFVMLYVMPLSRAAYRFRPASMEPVARVFRRASATKWWTSTATASLTTGDVIVALGTCVVERWLQVRSVRTTSPCAGCKTRCRSSGFVPRRERPGQACHPRSADERFNAGPTPARPVNGRPLEEPYLDPACPMADPSARAWAKEFRAGLVPGVSG